MCFSKPKIIHIVFEKFFAACEESRLPNLRAKKRNLFLLCRIAKATNLDAFYKPFLQNFSIQSSYVHCNLRQNIEPVDLAVLLANM